MAVYCIATPQVTINTVDLSEYLKDVSLTYEADELETTASGDTSKEFIAGLKSWKVDATVNQDYTASKVAFKAVKQGWNSAMIWAHNSLAVSRLYVWLDRFRFSIMAIQASPSVIKPLRNASRTAPRDPTIPTMPSCSR